MVIDLLDTAIPARDRVRAARRAYFRAKTMAQRLAARFAMVEAQRELAEQRAREKKLAALRGGWEPVSRAEIEEQREAVAADPFTAGDCFTGGDFMELARERSR